ncbi:DinB/UmuC family translesion DNA polymerase [Spongiibacter marinus]|uniref:DinB/UmuC family translesion DNA polymerase n=1 Tax=Spongiibacter marinus TaxID=354246 RepID=UPI00356A63E5
MQQIVCSRSFSKRVESLDELRESVASYTVRAAEKLGAEQQVCKMLSVSLRTDLFNPTEPIYSYSAVPPLATPTNDSNQLINVATRLLRAIWRPGYRYAKAGVMLSELSRQGQGLAGLFSTPEEARREQLMQTIDQINERQHGRVFIAAQGIQQEWSMKRRYLSPGYTTRWNEIPLAWTLR